MTKAARKAGRVLRRVLLGLVVLLVLLALTLTAALYSETVFRETLRIAQPMIPGELEYEHIEGTLAGRIELTSARYEIAGTRVEAEHLAFNPSALALLRGRVALGAVEARRLLIQLPARDGDDDGAPARPREILDKLRLPVEISARSLDVSEAVLLNGQGNPLLVLDRLALGLKWTDEAIVIEDLHAVGPEIEVDGNVSLGLAGNHATDIDVQGRWQGLKYPVAGSVRGSGDAGEAAISARISEPVDADIEAQLSELLDTPQWRGRLVVRDVQPSRFINAEIPAAEHPWSAEMDFEGGWRDTRVQFTAAGSWPPAEGVQLKGIASINAQRTGIQQLDASIASFDTRLSLRGQVNYDDKLIYSAEGRFDTFSWPQLDEIKLRDGKFSVAGDAERADATVNAAMGGTEDAALRANATFSFYEKQFNAELQGEQLQLVIQENAVAVETLKAHVDGRVNDYRMRVQARGRYADLPPAEIQARGQGNAQGLLLDVQSLRWLDGEASGDVRINWQDAVDVHAQLQARGFELAQLQPDLNATVGGRFGATINLTGDQPDVQLKIDSLNGDIAGRRLGGEGNLRMRDGRLSTSGLRITAGDAQIRLQDAPGNAFDFEIDAPSLAELYPPVAGSLQASGRFGGALERPNLQLQAQASNLAWQDMRVDAMNLDANIRKGGERESELTLRANTLQTGTLSADTLELDLRGSQESHRLKLEIDNADDSEQGGLSAALSGGWDGDRWRGRVQRLQASHPELGVWSLDEEDTGEEASRIITVHADGRAQVPEHCLSSEAGYACVGPLERTDEQWQANASLRQVPIALFAAWLPLGPDYRGSFNAELGVTGDDSGMRGSAELELSPGSVRQTTEEDAVTLLGWTGGRAKVDFSGREMLGNLEIPLAEGGRISGNGRLELPPDGKPRINAQVQAETDNLGLLPTLIPELTRLQGRFEANLSVEGELESPEVRGEAHLRDGSARILALGTDWNNVQLTLVGRGREISLSGHAEAGKGHIDVELEGRDTGDGFSGKASITGRDFKAMHTPEADIDISPDLRMELDNRELRIGGDVLVPYAMITPRDLSTATQPSDDQVIVNAEERAREEGLAVYARVTTKLGNDVHVESFGLTAQLDGQITVTKRPESPPTAIGRLNVVEGQYKAYGQDLTLQRGQVIYTGQQLSNPGLDISATRKPTPDITVGVNVRGSLSQPRMSVFSEPEMSETEALSYLLFGRSLNEASSAQEREVNNAAIALGLGGQKLLGRVGEKLGVEELRIEKASEKDAASLVLGKYLSPDLYVSYGIGLYDAVNTFRIRYRLSSKWTLEATSGLKNSADFVYTIER